MPNTTVTITNQTSTGGTVTIRQGELSGKSGRTVILEATPATGYAFEKWEIETTPIRLQEFTKVGARYNSVEEACSAPSVDLINPLYSDGTELYTDVSGQYTATPGIYQSARGTYYNYTGAGIPPLLSCPTPSTEGTPSAGTSTSGGGGGRFGGVAGGFDNTTGQSSNELFFT